MYLPVSRIRRPETGFTLIELLVVLTVISILSLFAIPAYQNYVTRTLVVTELPYIGDIRARLSDFYMNNGYIPDDNEKAGLKAPTDYAHSAITQIYLSKTPVEGSLIVEFEQRRFGDANLLIFTPSVATGTLEWSCKDSTINAQFLPTQCR